MLRLLLSSDAARLPVCVYLLSMNTVKLFFGRKYLQTAHKIRKILRIIPVNFNGGFLYLLCSNLVGTYSYCVSLATLQHKVSGVVLSTAQIQLGQVRIELSVMDIRGFS